MEIYKLINRIVFPTDFSIYSANAREYVMELAKSLGSKVYIIHAIEPIKYEEDDEEIQEFYKKIELEIENKIENEKEYFIENDITVYTDTIIGPSWKVINTYAKEKDIDLIVMGSHGYKTERDEIVIGTTSHKVVLTSPCPVLIVRNEKG
ncbi:MAG: universal stress protein [Candidatus Dadabacteria bacterium]|nr:universal stress protein [Candidatus Dadabacteria bacterium]